MPHSNTLGATKSIYAHRPRPGHIRRFTTTADGMVIALPPRTADVSTARRIVTAAAGNEVAAR